MRLAQLSDFHYTALTLNPFRLFPKRFIGQLNWLLHRKNAFCPQKLASLPELFQTLQVDYALFGGDFTSTSMEEEFALASQFVQQFKTRWIAIPGNHDHYTTCSFRKKRFYHYFSNPPPTVFSLAKDKIEGHQISPDTWVISLDTSRPTSLASSQGLFTEDLERKLEHFLSLIPEGEKVILFNHYPYLLQEETKRNLQRAEALEQILRNHPKIVLYLHGHTHRHSIADLRANGLPLTLDSGSCASETGGSWNLIDLHTQGCTVTPYFWNEKWEKQPPKEYTWD